jgi:hypothetical protein
MQSLTLIQQTHWNSVLDEWREREKGFGWEAIYEPRGFKTWDEWRKTYWEKLALDKRDWTLQSVADPSTFFQQLWVTAYSGWKKYYPEGANVATVGELARHSNLLQNGKVKAIISAPPKETTVIVIQQGERYALFEGLHRAHANVIATQNGRPLPTSVHIALTVFGENEEELFEGAITQK